ncbi:MAG TPA: hypothetical protein VKQ05_02910 [Gemmatimonadales bacterium]|nr:hypothetical protein [Gemmatimonadales bacterium]
MARVHLLIGVVCAVACKRVGIVEPPPPPPPGTHVGWYVTTNGTSSGDGSNSAPWDLNTALNGGNGKVAVGDTIWLRQGTYAGQFYSGLSGTAANPIIVRGYPGERVTLDGGTGGTNRIETLTVNGAYTIYRDFEVMQSSTARTGPAGTGTPLRPTGIYILQNAHDLKFVNLIIHDTGHGFYTENTAHNIEIYGCVIYNGGDENQPTGGRSDGHGIYIKGDGIGWKVARDNVIFDQFGFGIHGYAESGQALKGLVFDGNAIFNNGTPSDYTDNANLQLGGTVVADNDSVTNNVLYFSPGVVTSSANVRIGYSTTANGAALVRGNTMVGGTLTFVLGYWANLTVQSNAIVGPSLVVLQNDVNSPTTQHWSSNTHYRDPTTQSWQFKGTTYTFPNWETAIGATDAASATLPSTAQVIVRPNRYEAGRANIIVLNWGSASAVDVSVGSILNNGDTYAVWNAQDIFGNPIASGTYSGGGTISIPMGGVTPPQPIGGSFQPLHKTGPAFDVFVLRKS